MLVRYVWPRVFRMTELSSVPCHLLPILNMRFATDIHLCQWFPTSIDVALDDHCLISPSSLQSPRRCTTRISACWICYVPWRSASGIAFTNTSLSDAPTSYSSRHLKQRNNPAVRMTRSAPHADDILSAAYISAISRYANDFPPISAHYEDDVLSAAYISSLAEYANMGPSKPLKRHSAVRRRTLQRPNPSPILTGAPALAQAYITDIGSNPFDTYLASPADIADQASCNNLGSSAPSEDGVSLESSCFSRSSTGSTTSSTSEHLSDERSIQDENVDSHEDVHSSPHQKVWFRLWPKLRLRIPGSGDDEVGWQGLKPPTNAYEGRAVKPALYRV
jgi:hypothetical protein